MDVISHPQSLNHKKSKLSNPVASFLRCFAIFKKVVFCMVHFQSVSLKSSMRKKNAIKFILDQILPVFNQFSSIFYMDFHSNYLSKTQILFVGLNNQVSHFLLTMLDERFVGYPKLKNQSCSIIFRDVSPFSKRLYTVNFCKIVPMLPQKTQWAKFAI